jgi:hypothetical protein
MPRGQPNPAPSTAAFPLRVNKRAKWVALQSAHTIFQPDSGPQKYIALALMLDHVTLCYVRLDCFSWMVRPVRNHDWIQVDRVF